ncbi:ribosomal protein S18-alanine N-acetyltransferase [Aristophania vespae]|uniref:[Ribosomal protein bS18]-alanine N-acetyltransferase n=1 Tax=Aristophania vespae TaxID=2697033 RepID=A0A6P1N995_9PROT|nr:ribosomal protein S18-alanine N-acetyltransferase [Aristophania vespae]QHI94986.1 ribosomal protein S18-alanine N-acetyltransferase [Aristophania vespae]UMM64154.1 N-alpha-acetyltransferase RimI [Aristophania vespae]
MIIHEIGLEGAALFATLHQEAFKGAEIWNEAAFRELLSLPNVKGWVASRDDQPLGFLLVRTVLDESEVLTIGVLPSVQRSGVGCALIENFVVSVKEIVKNIYLEVSLNNKKAYLFYQSQGFFEIGRRPCYYSDGTDAFLLKREIP